MEGGSGEGQVWENEEEQEKNLVETRLPTISLGQLLHRIMSLTIALLEVEGPNSMPFWTLKESHSKSLELKWFLCL